MNHIGKIVILAGVILVVVGVLITFFGRIPFLGKLPGDVHVKRDNFEFFFPVTTSILLSVVLSFLFWLFAQISRR